MPWRTWGDCDFVLYISQDLRVSEFEDSNKCRTTVILCSIHVHRSLTVHTDSHKGHQMSLLNLNDFFAPTFLSEVISKRSDPRAFSCLDKTHEFHGCFLQALQTEHESPESQAEGWTSVVRSDETATVHLQVVSIALFISCISQLIARD